METGYADDVESVDISGFSEYVNLVSSRADIYGQTGVNPGQVQLLVDEHNGKTEPVVREYLESLADEGLLELEFDEMNKMPESYSMTDKGRYVLNPNNQKQLGEDYWVGQKEDLLVVFGEDYSLEQEFASETVAKTHFQRLNEENAETLLEP